MQRRNIQLPKLCIIIPCFNEEDNIDELLIKLSKHVPLPFEIIYIDDGSSDKTLEKIKKQEEIKAYIKHISFSRNFGHQAALKAGLDHASGDCVITMDADLQHPPKLIPELLKRWQEGYDIVQCIRKDVEHTGFLKRFTSKMFYKIINLLSEIKIQSGSADFRLLDKKVVLTLREFTENQLFLRGLIPWLGFSQYNIEYIPDKRNAGVSKYSLFKMMKLASAGVTSFSIKPLKLAIFIGLFISLGTFIYAFYAISVYLFSNHAISGWTSIILSILFIGGLQILLLGIIGEYLGKLFLENKKRPLYIIKDKKT